jgi:hypothetical protein
LAFFIPEGRTAGYTGFSAENADPPLAAEKTRAETKQKTSADLNEPITSGLTREKEFYNKPWERIKKHPGAININDWRSRELGSNPTSPA